MEPRFFADTAFWIALFRRRDQYHRAAMEWQRYLIRSRALIVTTEAVCWEWLNAMSNAAIRGVAGEAYQRVCRDPSIEVVPHSAALSAQALRLFVSRSDKDWSLTDCLSFVVMSGEKVSNALTADNHFEQAGFQAVLLSLPPASE